MSYTMSQKVKSLMFLFGFMIMAVIYNTIEEEQLVKNGDSTQQVVPLEEADINTHELTSKQDIVDIN